MRVGIVGAGPAGSHCAALLARAGLEVHLFDHRGVWEKPCGGGLTQKALDRYPFLRNSLEIKQPIDELELISPGDRRAQVKLDTPLLLYSRTVLNGLLLQLARSGGAVFHPVLVQDFQSTSSGWNLQAGQQQFELDFLVGADGVNSSIRARMAERFTTTDLVMTYGYRIPGNGVKAATIKFFPDLIGYAWIFPRPGHLSVGIGAKLGRPSTPELKQKLHDFVRSYFQSNPSMQNSSQPPAESDSREVISAVLDDAEIYSALIPSLSSQSLRRNQVAGKSWALIGDAAGFADPITSEGIYYALRSGELLAESLIQGLPDKYPRRCELDFVRDFIHAADMSETFYLGKVGWTDWLTLMVRTVSRSPALQILMNQLMAGHQEYGTLIPHVIHLLPQVVLDLAGLSRKKRTVPSHGNP